METMHAAMGRGGSGESGFINPDVCSLAKGWEWKKKKKEKSGERIQVFQVTSGLRGGSWRCYFALLAGGGMVEGRFEDEIRDAWNKNSFFFFFHSWLAEWTCTGNWRLFYSGWHEGESWGVHCSRVFLKPRLKVIVLFHSSFWQVLLQVFRLDGESNCCFDSFVGEMALLCRAWTSMEGCFKWRNMFTWNYFFYYVGD